MSINNSVAVVTGGTSGIGAAVVELLVLQGVTCFVWGRKSDKGKRFIADMNNKLPGKKGYVKFMQVDVSQHHQIQDAVKQINKEYGAPELLVNSAGINIRKSALSFSQEEWNTVLNTNLSGVFFTCQELAKGMKTRGYGSIVNIGSMTSHYGVPNVVAYAAAKGAINQLTKTLALEWSAFGIRVNQVSPGYIETPLNQDVFSNKIYRDTLQNRIPLKRLGKPEDVAKTVVFLLTKDAEYITGQIIAVDGGILGGDPTLNPLQKDKEK